MDPLERDLRKLVGTPYEPGGRGPSAGPGAGWDCVTFVAEVYRRLGRIVRLPAVYEAGAMPAEEWEILHEFYRPCAPAAWALVLFGDEHVGVLLPSWDVIHCQIGVGVVVHPLGRVRPAVAGFLEPVEAAA